MSLSSTGLTQDVIREMMPPYHLSPDLLEAMFAALPPPPPDAPATWRQARITRLMQEISTLMPANAARARLASQIVQEMAEYRSICRAEGLRAGGLIAPARAPNCANISSSK